MQRTDENEGDATNHRDTGRLEAWVAGEALIDLLPDGRGGRKAIVGGGSANTAKSLALLGITTRFIDGISSDEYGAMARLNLEAAGVDLSLAVASTKPTALAEVSLDDDGKASYEFSLEGTASFDFCESWLPRGKPAVLHVGTLATIVEPGSDALHRWAERTAAPVVYDPNERSSFLADRVKYRSIVDRWTAISDVVKFSEDDLRWLHSGAHGEDAVVDLARAALSRGPSLVVVTRGEAGMVGVTRRQVVAVPGIATSVIDTVGAGDTVGAVLAEGIIAHGLEGLCADRLRDVLERAARAAAITCSRAGANPPRAAELNPGRSTFAAR